MLSDSLFDAVDRTSDREKSYSESSFAFLSRSSWPESARMRHVLENWYFRYPAGRKSELRSRFRADSWSYESAFFELCLHELLLRLNCEVVIHPEFEATPTHPDFLVRAPSGYEFVLEAVLATNQPSVKRRAAAVFDKLFDELNRLIASSDFFISIDLNGNSTRQPSANKIAAFLERQLAQVNADTLTSDYQLHGERAIPRWEYPIDDDCYLEFSPIPRKKECRHQANDRPIGVIGSEAHFVENVAAIRNAVLKKSNRYGKLKHPFVVAVNLMSETVEENDRLNSLFARDGVFRRDRARTVSAVLMFDWLMPISIPRANPRLFHNPLADQAYESVLKALPQAVKNSADVELIDGRGLHDIFELGPQWPHEQAPVANS